MKRILILSFLISSCTTGYSHIKVNDIHHECMALNIYHEARGEKTIGQEAVAWVTMNRVNSKKYPNSVCGVIWQNKQFSWTWDKISDKPKDKKSYEKAKKIAEQIMNGSIKDPTNGALWYHADYVDPYWNKELKFEKKIGIHLFYTKP